MRGGAGIVVEARRWIGQREIPPNRGFSDAEFERLMREVGGWRPGWAWCACFVRLCVLRGALWTPEEERWLRQSLQPGVLNTWRAFQAAGRIRQSPTIGSIAFWRNGATAFGHAGIVSAVESPSSFRCIEGNTGALGGRDGEMVRENARRVDFTRRARGLWLLGFGALE